MVTDTNEVEQLQSLLALSIENDFYEEPAWEFIKDNDLSAVSNSRQYLINLAWNNGWRPEPVISNS